MTTIGPSLVITGELTSQEDITIHGRVKGQIRMNQGTLLLAPAGHIEADVNGASVTVHGKLAGDVSAQRIELTPTSHVLGTLTAPAIVIHDGSSFNGIVDMSDAAAVATLRAVPTLVPTSRVAQAS
jgi:cytoskeletal protein CcmA (bactofilin family)